MSDPVLHLSDFFPFLDQDFHTQVDGRPVTLLLTEAEKIKTWSLEDSPREPFHLIFKVVEGEVTEQQIVSLSHKRGGSWDVFVAPVLSQKSGLYLQAIFN